MDLLCYSLRSRKAGPVVLIKLTEQGTIALISPLLNKLSSNQEILILTTDQSKEIFDSFDFIKKQNIYTLKTDSIKNFLFTARDCLININKQNPSTVIDLQFFSFISMIISYLILPSTIARFSFNQINLGSNLKKVTYRKKTHISQLHRQIFEKALNISLSINESPHSRIKAIRTISLFPNYSDLLPLRTWPLHNWLLLIKCLQEKFPQYQLQIIGEEKDYEIITEALNKDKIDYKGKFVFSSKTVPELIENLRSTDLFISSDCGPAHFARVAGAITLTLFGPESPEVFGGNSPDSFYLYKNLACSPCFNQVNGCLSFCSKNVCIDSISVDETIETIRTIIEKYHDS